jgi:hypothetical protein
MKMIRHDHICIQSKLPGLAGLIKRLTGNFLYLVGSKYRQTVFSDRCQKVTGCVSGNDMHKGSLGRLLEESYGSRSSAIKPKIQNNWCSSNRGAASKRKGKSGKAEPFRTVRRQSRVGFIES